jgi:pimeloyl-ACP methyl ester carboxylesterase
MIEIEKRTGTFSSFDGTSIYYEVRGSGEPIILVYGIACLMNHWHHQVSYLSQKFSVITFDLRGHHKSDTPDDKNNLSVKAIAKDVDHLMKHLKIEKAHFAGHSFGVPILIEFAYEFPQKVSSLTFINGFAKNPIKGMFGLDVIEPFYFFIKSQYESYPAFWKQFWKIATHNPMTMWLAGFAGGFNLKLTQFKDIEVYSKGVSQIDLQTFLTLFEDLMRFDGEPLLEKITAPCLIMSGERDSVTPLQFQQLMHEKLKGSKFILVPYGSHCTQLDFPDYTNMSIEKHILSVKDSPK